MGQSLCEIHMVAFMLWGKFFEFGKRLTGISYVSTLRVQDLQLKSSLQISTLPARPPEQQAPGYEALGVMLVLPILYRLFQRPLPLFESTQTAPTAPRTMILPLSPPLTPPLTANETIVLSKPALYDDRNTYLTPSVLALPERQCTLCLEPRGTGEGSGGTVAVTECGHVFCWGCLGGLEKVQFLVRFPSYR